MSLRRQNSRKGYFSGLSARDILLLGWRWNKSSVSLLVAFQLSISWKIKRSVWLCLYILFPLILRFISRIESCVGAGEPLLTQTEAKVWPSLTDHFGLHLTFRLGHTHGDSSISSTSLAYHHLQIPSDCLILLPHVTQQTFTKSISS